MHKSYKITSWHWRVCNFYFLKFIFSKNHWAGRDFKRPSGINYPGQMVSYVPLVLPGAWWRCKRVKNKKPTLLTGKNEHCTFEIRKKREIPSQLSFIIPPFNCFTCVYIIILWLAHKCFLRNRQNIKNYKIRNLS